MGKESGAGAKGTLTTVNGSRAAQMVTEFTFGSMAIATRESSTIV